MADRGKSADLHLPGPGLIAVGPHGWVAVYTARKAMRTKVRTAMMAGGSTRKGVRHGRFPLAPRV